MSASRHSTLARVALVTCSLALAHSAAAANVCATIDESTDTLEAGERRAALAVLKQTLVANGDTVSATDCAETYTVSHARLGKTVSVSLTSPKGTRNGTAGTIEELPGTYDQLVKALKSGKALGESGVADRHNVTLDQAAPKRVQADNLGYVTLGYATIFGGDAAYGPTLGGGYRYELDRFAVDANLQLAMGQSSAPATQAGFAAGIRGLYYFDPTASSSAYVGGGLSFAALSTEVSSVGYSSAGLAGRATLGYEFLRESTIRFLVEADAQAPFFMLKRDADLFSSAAPSGGPSSVYAPTLGVNLGIAWGSANQTVQNVRLF
jgi:hypothetical protein